MTPDAFTDRARRVMQLADQEARRLSCEYIATEHLLLGILKAGPSIAVNLLSSHGVDIRQVCQYVDQFADVAGDTTATRELPLTPRVQRAIGYALEDADDLNHAHVDAEHVLLGLLRDHGTAAVQMLMNLGLDAERLRNELLELLRHGSWPEIRP